MTNIADYLDYVDPTDRGVAGFGLGRLHGGHHHGHGHPGHWGGHGWGGGWGWNGPAYWGQVEPQIITVEREARAPERYIGVRPGETLRCAQQPIGDGLWRCHLGTIYDITKWELRANGLVRRGLAGMAALPFRPTLTTPVPTAVPRTVLQPSAARLIPRQALVFPTTPSPTPTPTPTPTTPDGCPAGSMFDATQNACVCAAGTGPNADGTACVPTTGAGGGDEGSSSGWLWIAVGAFVAWRALKK